MKGNCPYSFAGQEQVPTPQLLYFPEIIQQNIGRMVALAGGTDRLWPHIKTYKMEPVLHLLMQAGIRKFKCATIAELELAVRTRAEAALLAYPLVGPNIPRFLAICRDFPGTRIYAIADDTHQAETLGAQAAQMGITVRLLMDIDMGQHRTGVAPERAAELYRRWNNFTGIAMSGLHCYDGQRHEHALDERLEAARPGDKAVAALRRALLAEGLDCRVVVMGGTPSFPCHRDLTDAYLSPGTCVVQDAGYRAAFRDLPFTPAAVVLTRVISHPTKDMFTLDMGTKAVACDPPIPRATLVGLEDAETVMQNEEHWVLRFPKGEEKRIPPIGTELFAIPVHICPTAILYPYALAIENGRIAECWPVAARDRRITY